MPEIFLLETGVRINGIGLSDSIMM